MPELPEVQALVDFLRERTEGLVVTGVELGSISVLKTFTPPPQALVGRSGRRRLDGTASSSTSTAAERTWCSTWPARAGCGGPTRCRRRCSGRASRRSPCGCASTTRRASTSPRRAPRSGSRPTSSVGPEDGARHRLARARTRWPTRSPSRSSRRSRRRTACRSRACCATSRSSPASATPTPTRCSTWPSCRRSPSPRRSSDDDVERLYTALRGTLASGGGRGIRQAREGAQGRQAGRDAGARAHRRDLPRVRRRRARGVVRRLLAAVLRDLPDRRQAARRPAGRASSSSSPPPGPTFSPDPGTFTSARPTVPVST